jgi:hypothetical protein
LTSCIGAWIGRQGDVAALPSAYATQMAYDSIARAQSLAFSHRRGRA